MLADPFGELGLMLLFRTREARGADAAVAGCAGC